ncbi:HAD family hydrolase [Thiohalocapsa sp. ML1]|jgi:hydroxymethylpyrimidine pyrophosphatase-like HAD family hydrolase|uniref:HAD family hydrolase n=1 Tax=Thiohalocapsa sp. ML1 TaxID=1431688 RepID=UPI0009E825B9|nr:HAD family hydrolase [Thiohalocapsa sp. ML1]
MTPDTFVLATDLDGTLLGGDAATRRRFYQWLAGLGERCILIFVTGRALADTLPLLDAAGGDEPLPPRPRWIISDIGTRIVDGDTLAPIAPLQDWVAAAWGDAGARVRALLADEPAIAPQAVDAPYRVSYFFDPADFPRRIADKIAAAGFDCLLSHEMYLDVLPRGVAKGPALLRLLEYAGLAEHPVVVAGDTLNDLSLFQTGLPGIAVGNAEDGLLDAIRHLPRVHLSAHPGVLGIHDGLRAHGLCDGVPWPDRDAEHAHLPLEHRHAAAS